MQFTINQVATLLNGSLDKPHLGETMLSKIAKIEEAQAGSLCFLANRQYEHFLYTCQASAVLVAHDFEPKTPIETVLIKVKNPYEAFATLLQKYQAMTQQKQTGIHATAIIASDAQIGEMVFIGAYVVIEEGVKIADNCSLQAHCFVGKNSAIGEQTTLFSGVKIYHNIQIGKNCTLHAGTIIGSDGFGFAPVKEGVFQKIPQMGNVIIEDNVEIGANCCIDRATLGSTIIRNGVKLDNLIQVAHNVEIGENTVIAAQTGISGSTKIGKNCMIGGQVGFAGHIAIADGSKINAQSGISKSIKEPDKSWSGTPAREFRQHYKGLAFLNKIPDLIAKVEAIENSLKK